MLRFPGRFSGEKISSRMKRETADSLGSTTRRGGAMPNGDCPGAARRAMSSFWGRNGGGEVVVDVSKRELDVCRGAVAHLMGA